MRGRESIKCDSLNNSDCGLVSVLLSNIDLKERIGILVSVLVCIIAHLTNLGIHTKSKSLGVNFENWECALITININEFDMREV